MFAMLPEDEIARDMHHNLNKMRIELRHAQDWIDRAISTHIQLEEMLIEAENQAIEINKPKGVANGI